MSLYKRGDVWWYKFWFSGQLNRESSKSDSKTVAKDAEHARRHELEQAYNHIPKRQRMPLFSHAAELWLASKAGLAENSRERYEQYIETTIHGYRKIFSKHIAGKPIASIQIGRFTTKDGQDWLDSLPQKLSHKTHLRIRASLSGVLTTALQSSVINHGRESYGRRESRRIVERPQGS